MDTVISAPRNPMIEREDQENPNALNKDGEQKRNMSVKLK